MTMTTARVRRRSRAVRRGQGKRREHWMRRGKRSVKKRARGRHWRKGRTWGREMVKGKILLNKPQEEKISLVLLLYSCRKICMRQTSTLRANYRGYYSSQKHRLPCHIAPMRIPTLLMSRTANLTQNGIVI
jgi:hypothetical protein